MPKWKDGTDALFASVAPPAGTVTPRRRVLRQVFGLLGIVTAVAAGFYTYDRLDSAWPAVFVALIALQIVARAIPDLITDDKKVRRALYFAMGPALASGIFYFSYEAWETYWLSFVVALLGGAILIAILGPLLFPAIHREEKADSASRWGLGSSDS